MRAEAHSLKDTEAVETPKNANPRSEMRAFREIARTDARVCPICLGSKFKIVSAVKGRELRKCFACGGSHLFPQPSSSEITTHFESPDGESDRELEVKFERNREPVLRRVATYIQKNKPRGTVLDVGCATGLFLSRFFRGSDWQTVGVELSPRKAERAVRNGIDVFVGDVHHAHFATESFDVLTILDAFYYFPSPELDLKEFSRILKPDGFLVLELPWANARIWRRSARIRHLLNGDATPLLESSDHLFYYTPESITRLLQRCGLHVVKILPLSGNRQETLIRDLLWRTYSLISKTLNVISASKIFLGPRFLVVARKDCSAL